MKKTPKNPSILSKGARAWFMALCIVGNVRISARRRLFWNLLNFSEPEGGLNKRLILFFLFSLSLLYGALYNNPPVRYFLVSRSRDSVSTSVRDTNSSMSLLGVQVRAGWVDLSQQKHTAKTIFQACNGLRVQQPHLRNLTGHCVLGDELCRLYGWT